MKFGIICLNIQLDNYLVILSKILDNIRLNVLVFNMGPVIALISSVRHFINIWKNIRSITETYGIISNQSFDNI